MTRRTAEPESDALLRLKQQIIAAITDDPDAIPDLIVELGLIDYDAAVAVMDAIERASDRVEADRG